jgi:hypothetical protein
MKNITITLDAKTAAWARVHAAKHGKSVSRLVGEMLHEHMREWREYQEAMRRYLSKGPFKELKGPAQAYPRREDLHDRTRLR